MASTLVAQLDALHDHYVFAVNEAVAADDHARVARLVADHDRRSAELVARHESGRETVRAEAA
jgi:hypothetical protein